MNLVNNNKKIRIIALIEPLNLKMSLCFPLDGLISDIHYFIEDVMRRYTVKYKVGRIEWNGAWILPQYKISDFLQDMNEITVYSVEHGLTMKTLPTEKERVHVNYSVFEMELNNKFISKKTLRDKKNKSTTNFSKTNEADNVDNDEVFTNPPISSLESAEHYNNSKNLLKEDSKEQTKDNKIKSEKHKLSKEIPRKVEYRQEQNIPDSNKEEIRVHKPIPLKPMNADKKLKNDTTSQIIEKTHKKKNKNYDNQSDIEEKFSIRNKKQTPLHVKQKQKEQEDNRTNSMENSDNDEDGHNQKR